MDWMMTGRALGRQMSAASLNVGHPKVHALATSSRRNLAAAPAAAHPHRNHHSTAASP